jgi:hypothetical protein
MNDDAEMWLDEYYNAYLLPSEDEPSIKAIENALRAAMQWAYADAIKVATENMFDKYSEGDAPVHMLEAIKDRAK